MTKREQEREARMQRDAERLQVTQLLWLSQNPGATAEDFEHVCFAGRSSRKAHRQFLDWLNSPATLQFIKTATIH